AGRAESAFAGIYNRARDLDHLLSGVTREREASHSGSAAVLRAGYRQVRRLLDEDLPRPEVREAG
ncbi:MAG: hypothetical protein GWN36_18445, partial [Gemmatimonadetes bacterium]|nr:hypothetical protein [Gemmatimonadota bacterium]